jgi:hypothetical protein
VGGTGSVSGGICDGSAGGIAGGVSVGAGVVVGGVVVGGISSVGCSREHAAANIAVSTINPILMVVGLVVIGMSLSSLLLHVTT